MGGASHGEQAKKEKQHREQQSRREKQPKREEKIDFDLLRHHSYAEYEAAFVALQEQALREKVFDPRRVPLPPKGMVMEPSPQNAEVWYRNLRKATLRWHPDRWSRLFTFLPDEESREALKQIVNGMFRAVTRAKEKGPPPS